MKGHTDFGDFLTMHPVVGKTAGKIYKIDAENPSNAYNFRGDFVGD